MGLFKDWLSEDPMAFQLIEDSVDGQTCMVRYLVRYYTHVPRAPNFSMIMHFPPEGAYTEI